MPETYGASVTVDGITSRPTYGYTPPDVFFNGGPLPAGTPVYDVRDYGAVADAAVDSRTQIQAAVDAAFAAGGGLVYVPAGTYGITGSPTLGGNGGIYLKQNVFMIGDGMGQTTLRVMDGWNGPMTGIVRSPPGIEKSNYGLADITLDGNRANSDGKVDAFYCGVTPEQPLTDRDVWVLRTEAMNCEGYGFDPHERTTRLTIADSVAHHNGLDGFVADYIVDGEYRNNLAYANDRHGFNIVTTSNDLLLKDNVARDNLSAGITVQRGSFNIPSPYNIKIEGGEVYGNAREGVLVRMSDNVLITGVDIHDNGRMGVRIYGSSHVTVEGNTITDNSVSGAGTYPDIQIEENADPTVAQKTYVAEYNLIRDNVLTADPTHPTSYGVLEKVGLVGHNLVEGNTMTGQEDGLVLFISPTSILHRTGGNAAEVLAGVTAVGIDWIEGGGGNDSINGGDGMDSLLGGDGDDSLTGGKGTNVLDGGAGHDRLLGDLGNDTLAGGDGNDTLSAGGGDNRLDGGAGDDRLTSDGGSDALQGGDGNDSLAAGGGADSLEGGLGSDTLVGGLGDDLLAGGAGADQLNGGAEADSLAGGAGGDTLLGGEGDDTLDGGLDNDAIWGGNGTDRLEGRAGNDRLFGEGGGDVLRGGDGDDRLLGGAGNDSLAGGTGNDLLFGHSESDLLAGGTGNDTLYGGLGGDRLFGEAGADWLVGGGGDDVLNGGAGADLFVIEAGSGRDTVVGFENGLDRFLLRNAGPDRFADLTVAADGGNVRVSWVGGEVLLTGVGAGQIDARDFLFE